MINGGSRINAMAEHIRKVLNLPTSNFQTLALRIAITMILHDISIQIGGVYILVNFVVLLIPTTTVHPVIHRQLWLKETSSTYD